jgi:hypothetical protein
MGFQFVNFEEHCYLRAPSWYRAGRGSTHRGVSSPEG